MLVPPRAFLRSITEKAGFTQTSFAVKGGPVSVPWDSLAVLSADRIMRSIKVWIGDCYFPAKRSEMQSRSSARTVRRPDPRGMLPLQNAGSWQPAEALWTDVQHF
jgi:hypothetical protein